MSEDGDDFLLGADVAFGQGTPGCSGIVQVQLERTTDGGLQVNVDHVDLTIAETRRLAAHLLSLASIAEGAPPCTSTS